MGEGFHDLGARALVVGPGIGLVAVLEGHEPARVALRHPQGEPHGAVRPFRGRGEDEPRAVELEQLAALGGRVLGEDAGEGIALELRHHGERDPGVAAGRLEELAPGLELAGGLCGLDHRLGYPVLDRARWVLALELRVEPDAGVRGEPWQLDERRVPDRLEQGRRQRPLPAGHGRKQDHGRVLAHLRVEALERADVLAVEVDVDERRDAVAVLEHLPAQAGEALRQVGEHLAHGRAVRFDLAGAPDLGAQRRRDADPDHRATWCGAPWQNST